MGDAARGVGVGAEEGEERLDGHQVKERREGTALANAVRCACEATEVTVKVETDGVVVIEHGDESSERRVKAQGSSRTSRRKPQFTRS